MNLKTRITCHVGSNFLAAIDTFAEWGEWYLADLENLRTQLIASHLCPLIGAKELLTVPLDDDYRGNLSVAELPKTFSLIGSVITRDDKFGNASEGFEGQGIFGFVLLPPSKPMIGMFGRIYFLDDPNDPTLTFEILHIPLGITEDQVDHILLVCKKLDRDLAESATDGERLDFLRLQEVIHDHPHLTKLVIGRQHKRIVAMARNH